MKKNHPTMTRLVIRLAALLFALAPAPAVADYLVRPFAMLGVDGGTHAFQITPEGWLRSGTATLAIGLDGAPLESFGWTAGGPGVARAAARSASGTLTVEAAAVRRPGLTTDIAFRGSTAREDTIRARVEAPILLARLRFEPAAGGSVPARLVLRLAADSGQDQAVTLHDGLVRRRITPARPAATWASGGRHGVAVADSLVLLVSAAPDSDGAGILVAGEPVPEVRTLVYRASAPLALEIRLPYFPVAASASAGSGGNPQISALAAGDGAELITAAGRAWQERLAVGAHLALPESVVVATATASLYHLLGGSLVAAGDRAAVLGAPFLYREFYMRDAAYLVVALDQFGYHQEARLALEAMFAYQGAAGEFLSHPEQHDGNGLALWALGEHVALTRDRAFAAEALPRAARSVGWLRLALAPFRGAVPGIRGEWDRDFPGILPATIMKDNEQVVSAHIVGHNLWASAGLAGAIAVARAAGAADSARAWQQLAGAFDRDLDRYLTALQERTSGLIAATFEGTGAQAGYNQPSSSRGGLDWGNLEIVYPTGVWRGDDARLRRSLDLWSERLVDGLYPYPLNFNPNLVHHYLPVALAHALAAAGGDADRRHLFAILYDGLLGHTTATGGGAELINTYTRDVWPTDNIPPHNTFSSRYLMLVRDLLVRERGDTLLVGAGLSPAWVVPGGRIALAGTATHFGWVDLGAEVRAAADSTATLALEVAVAPSPPARYLAPRPALPAPAPPLVCAGNAPPPAAVVLRAPLGYRITAARRGGGARVGAIRGGGRELVLPPAAAAAGVEIDLRGASDPDVSAAAARTRRGP
jgi:hypothetical protein